MNPEVITLGETMAMVSPSSPVPIESAERFQLNVGGAESTMALYLADLGHRVTWVSRFGNDPMGNRILATLSEHSVDTTWVEIDPVAPT